MGPRLVYTETKLNSAFSFGGPKCLVKVIQKLSGLSINRFIAIDFVGFARMVEAPAASRYAAPPRCGTTNWARCWSTPDARSLTGRPR